MNELDFRLWHKAAMRRRDFIKVVARSAIIWPLAARAQQPERMRRIGVLMSLAADDRQGQARYAAFIQGLRQLGWIEGSNLRIEIRWDASNPDRAQLAATEW
jgi:putative ABC transport system substrate-binding protein